MKLRIIMTLFLVLAWTVTSSFAEDLKRLKKIDSNISKGDYKTAITEGKQYLEKYPDSAKGWNVLGWAHVKNNQLQEAEKDFDQALAHDGKMANAYVGKGVVYRKLKKDDQARESYLQALALDPNSAAAYSSLLVIELQQNNAEKAVEYGEKAYHFNKKDASIAANLAIAYHVAGNMAKRDELYTVAKQLKYHNMAALDKRFGK